MLRVDRLTNALVKELQGWNEDLDVSVQKDTESNNIVVNCSLTFSQIADGGDLEPQMFGLTKKINKMQKQSIDTETTAISNVLLCEGLCCPECSKAMEQVDTTYSNTKTNRAEVGQHTGDIYYCEYCEQHYIDNLLTGNVEAWSY